MNADQLLASGAFKTGATEQIKALHQFQSL